MKNGKLLFLFVFNRVTDGKRDKKSKKEGKLGLRGKTEQFNTLGCGFNHWTSPTEDEKHTQSEISVCTHARRMNTERDNVVIHMLSSGARGSASLCFKVFGNLCMFVLTFHYRMFRCVCACVCVYIFVILCGLMHFLFSDTNMAGTGTENW